MQSTLFEAALGISDPWFVSGVDFDAAAKRLTIQIDPDGQLKLPRLWSRKIPHRVKQDEVEFYSSFVFCASASAASLSR